MIAMKCWETFDDPNAERDQPTYPHSVAQRVIEDTVDAACEGGGPYAPPSADARGGSPTFPGGTSWLPRTTPRPVRTTR